MKYQAHDIAKILATHIQWGRTDSTATGVCLDSRAVQPGDLFIAIRGERFDGDHFIEAAFAAGATICIGCCTHPQAGWDDRAYIRVNDGLESLQKVALFHRLGMGCKMAAVTGSNGKTTVKELVSTVLSSQYRTSKNPGNLNGQIGVPLSLLNAENQSQICVLEVGISAPDEMNKLVPIVKPDVAVLTNIGPVHLEFFGDEAHVLKEKGKLLESLQPNGLAVIDGDDERIRTFASLLPCQVISSGFGPGVDYAATEITSEKGTTRFLLSCSGKYKDVIIETCLLGKHNIKNILFAVAVADFFEIGEENLVQAIKSFQPLAMRQEIIRSESGPTIINDTYNASPLSMRAALESLHSFEGSGRRVAILGEMLELGEQSRHYHQELGRFICNLGLDLLITVGQAGEWISSGADKQGMEKKKLMHYKHKDTLSSDLGRVLEPGDIILVKASRGIALETLIQTIGSLHDISNEDTFNDNTK